jgi:hypothetical protein
MPLAHLVDPFQHVNLIVNDEVSFYRIRIFRFCMFFGLPDPDPLVRGASGAFPILRNVLSGLK